MVSKALMRISPELMIDFNIDLFLSRKPKSLAQSLDPTHDGSVIKPSSAAIGAF
jgi:ADP-ribosylglycohydrolase